LDWIHLFGLPSTSLKDTFLLYKKGTYQYKVRKVLKKVKLLIPKDTILKTKTEAAEGEEQDFTCSLR
jgi:hypothetical protein